MKSLRVLVVEDEEAVANLISLILKNRGFQCEIVTNVQDALSMVEMYEYDIIILDLVLGNQEGFSVLEKMRAWKINTPVLILSGLNQVDQKVKGLSLGADDYLTKPFDERELMLRINNIVQRAEGRSSSTMQVGEIILDSNKSVVSFKENVIPFTNKEYVIFELMMRRKGKLITKEILLNYLYGGMDEPDIKIIDVFFHKIRKKLAKLMGEKEIERYLSTVWGRGYILNDIK